MLPLVFYLTSCETNKSILDLRSAECRNFCWNINWISKRCSSTKWLIDKWSLQQWMLSTQDWDKTKNLFLWKLHTFNKWVTSPLLPCHLHFCDLYLSPSGPPTFFWTFIYLFIYFLPHLTSSSAGISMPICICVRKPSACCPSTHWSAWLVLCCSTPTCWRCCCSAPCWLLPLCRMWGKRWLLRKRVRQHGRGLSILVVFAVTLKEAFGCSVMTDTITIVKGIRQLKL